MYCPLMTGITFAQYHKSNLEAVLNGLQMHADIGSLSGTLLEGGGGSDHTEEAPGRIGPAEGVPILAILSLHLGFSSTWRPVSQKEMLFDYDLWRV